MFKSVSKFLQASFPLSSRGYKAEGSLLLKEEKMRFFAGCRMTPLGYSVILSVSKRISFLSLFLSNNNKRGDSSD